MDYVISMIGPIGQGLKVTLSLFLVVMVLSFPLGAALALVRCSSFRKLYPLVDVYVYVLRGTPLMLQILFVYFGLPFIPYIGMQLSGPESAVLAFTLNYGAYLCEIFRGGIQSISKGQYEAAKVLGFTYGQTMRKIIMPQVIKRILPPLANETITLLKDTSLVYILAMNDILRISRSIVQRDFDVTAFVVAGVFYLVMTFVITMAYQYVERAMSAYAE